MNKNGATVSPWSTPAEKLSDVVKDLFTDSKIAKEYGSKRTKATSQDWALYFLKACVRYFLSNFNFFTKW